MNGEYVIEGAQDALADLSDGCAKVVHLDDAWQRPKRCGGMGVEYPTHDVEQSFTIVDECWRVLREDGWLIADADDWFKKQLEDYLCEKYGNVAETYEGGGYRRTGGVTYLRSDAGIDRGGAGMYLRNAGYHVVFGTKPDADTAYEGARQVAHRPKEDWGWNNVKPLQPYLAWVDALCEDGDLVVEPCAGTAPASVAAERQGLEWWACDIEPAARDAFERRLSEQAGVPATKQAEATEFA